MLKQFDDDIFNLKLIILKNIIATKNLMVI